MPRSSSRFRVTLPSPDRLLWAVRVRWLVVGGFLFLAVTAHTLGLFASLAPCWQAAALGAVMNGLNHWCVRRRRGVALVTAVAIPLDHLLITYVVVNTGGVRSPFVMMYVVQVLATAMLVDTRVAAGSAVLAMVCWGTGIGLEAIGVLRVPSLFLPDRSHLVPRRVLFSGTWAAFLLYCLALLVYLGGYIAERLRSSERQLAENNRRLQDALESVRKAHAESSAAYDRLKQTETQLVHSEKMRSLGELVAGVAHELSNPISFISANVEHLRTHMKRLEAAIAAYASADGAETVRRQLRIDETLADLPGLLDDCEEGARRTKRIVNELRTFARSDERDGWQQADLHRGLDTTLALLAHRLKDGISVHRDYGQLPEVECLPGQLNQVFMNVLANAADAIGSKPGNIWITTRADRGDTGEVRSVIIAIRDDGPGIVPEIQAKIFDPFFTTKEIGQGTGLGLSVSYGIVQRHGGSLTVDGVPGGGATFTVTLPVAQPRSAQQVL